MSAAQFPERPREMAFRIALRFPSSVPTVKQLLEAFPLLDRSTAYRYIHEYRRACQHREAA